MGWQITKDFPPVYVGEPDTEGILEVLQTAGDDVRLDIAELVRQTNFERADEDFLDLLLLLLGWNVKIALTELQKRKLVKTVVGIYLTKGTAQGIIDASDYLLGETITIDEAIDDAWRLGISILGVDTILGSTTYLFHFFVHCAAAIAAQKEADLTILVDFMRPGFTTWTFIKDL